MKFHFDLTNLKALDAVQIERIQIDTEYSVAEFLTMTAEYPAVVEAMTKWIVCRRHNRKDLGNRNFAYSLRPLPVLWVT